MKENKMSKQKRVVKQVKTKKSELELFSIFEYCSQLDDDVVTIFPYSYSTI